MPQVHCPHAKTLVAHSTCQLSDAAGGVEISRRRRLYHRGGAAGEYARRGAVLGVLADDLLFPGPHSGDDLPALLPGRLRGGPSQPVLTQVTGVAKQINQSSNNRLNGHTTY